MQSQTLCDYFFYQTELFSTADDSVRVQSQVTSHSNPDFYEGLIIKEHCELVYKKSLILSVKVILFII